MKNRLTKGLLSLGLSVSMSSTMVLPAFAEAPEDPNSEKLPFQKVTDSKLSLDSIQEKADDTADKAEHADTDVVRVSIILDKASTLEQGYSTKGIASNKKAMDYRASLKRHQDQVAQSISKAINADLDVVWNMTLAGDIISANVQYGQIETIKEVAGVKAVALETQYTTDVFKTDEAANPDMATSSTQIGSNAAWADGYTGAGSRVAVIDTGIDTDHQSFDADAYEYSLSKNAEAKGMSVEEYKASLNLLDQEEISEVFSQLNIAGNVGASNVNKLTVSSKIPFAYNYIDNGFDVTHDNDTQGEHGSHVEGIAAANKYVKNAEGGFDSALDTVRVQGVAPDAQIVTMKVFGKGGGAYDSDYMIAIEDAIVLGCDSVNLSLGSSAAGFTREADAAYNAILNSLLETDTMVTISAGNNGYWAENAQTDVPALYGDDVSFHTGGSPGSYTNSLGVASADNIGFTGLYFSLGENDSIFYLEPAEYTNKPLTSISGDQEYIYIDGMGTPEDFAKLGDAIKGKIAVVSRGEISFYQKADNAASAGAIATIIYNNQPGTINMDLSDYRHTAPCVSITQAEGAMMKADGQPVTDEEGNVLYYQGAMHIEQSIASKVGDDFPMSDFSSWGVPGSLTMKPEITAPGGNIYSVNGLDKAGNAYENMSGTSMAAPQVAGMAALVGQYIRETGLDEKTGLTHRQLGNSLLMSTAHPVLETDNNNEYYSILSQGAGLANVGDAISADSYVMVDDNLSGTAADGKVKFELGDDPEKNGVYNAGFTLTNLKDTDQAFNLSAALFTQELAELDGQKYLDTWTTPLAAEVTFTVDGQKYVPESEGFSADVNKDGKTTSADARAILDHVTGKQTLAEDAAAKADVDGDGAITSKDAHDLLKSLSVKNVKLPAGGSVHVEVSAKLTDDEKANLNANYENGAYIEGFVFAETDNTAEGVAGTTHSIPVLGFYGNYADASMFDRTSYVQELYGTGLAPYTGNRTANNLTVKYAGDATAYQFTGNPYVVEDSFPADRAAVAEDTTLNNYTLSVIRNAGAVASYVKDANGKVIYLGPVQSQITGAYYNSKSAAWMSNNASLSIGKKVSSLGLDEGDQFEVGVVAVPEYYEMNNLDESGKMDSAKLTEMLENGTFDKGSSLSTKLTVDNTAPEVLSISKDLLTGDVTVVAKDNQYIAYMAVTDKSGSTTYAGGVPQVDEAGETVAIKIDLSEEKVGQYINVLVADYAGHETVYQVLYGGEPETYEGKMYGFTSSDTRGSGLRWVSVDPNTLSSTDGLNDAAQFDLDVYAAEYVDGYVVFSTDKALYIAKQGEWTEYTKMANVPSDAGIIVDMAFNYQNETLYALNDSNTLYSVDLKSGKLTKVADITVTNPRSTNASYLTLRDLAIDDEGNFYSANNGSGSYVYLYSWTLDQIADGALNIAPVVNDNTGYLYGSGLYNTGYSSMTYDHDKDILYFGAAYSRKNNNDVDNELWVVDPATGKAAHPNTLNAQFKAHVVGLYVVPSSSSIIPGDADVEEVVMSAEHLDLLKGQSVKMTADVMPWPAKDKSVTWSSSDESVVKVTAEGVVTAVGVGEAEITAVSNANPEISGKTTIAVEAVPESKFTALTGVDGAGANWSEISSDDPAAFNAFQAGEDFVAGTLHDGMIYLHDGDTMYGVDPDTFAMVNYGTIASSWIWSDAAAAPAENGLFGRMVALCDNGTKLEMINPEEGSLSYWDLASAFSEDPMAVIAYAGTGTYDYVSLFEQYYDCPAHFYYMMTESGHLYKLNVFTYNNGDGYSMVREDLGTTGLSLSGVSEVMGTARASLMYDENTGYLMLAKHADDPETRLYAIDPETMKTADLGNFGEGVYPVSALYQYERATDLTIKSKTTTLNTYVGDVNTIDAKVVLGETGELTWTTSDAAVATVENGTVTSLGAGTATITATTVDVNSQGEHVSKEFTVNVKELAQVNGTVSLQVTDANGAAKWAELNLQNHEMNTLHDGGAVLTGGGLAANALWGSDVEFGGTALGQFYKIDTQTYEETTGSQCSSDYAPVDLTDYSATHVDFTDADGNVHSADIPAKPIYIANVGNLYMLEDFAGGSISGWRIGTAMPDLGAIAYQGSFVAEEEDHEDGEGYDAGTEVKQYLAVSASGDVYVMQITAAMTKDEDTGEWTDGAYLARGSLGNLGMEFSSKQNMSAEFISLAADNYGLLISDSATGSVYYANLAGEQITCEKVLTVDGAANIQALFNAHNNEAGVENSLKKLALRKASETNASSAVSMHDDAVKAEFGMKAERLNASAESKGSLNSLNTVKTVERQFEVDTETGRGGVEIDRDNKTVTVKVAAKDSTNGKFELAYDAEKLNVASVVGTGISSWNAADGKVTAAFASEEAVTKADVVTVVFTYETDTIDTEITAVTLEDGDNLTAGEPVVLDVYVPAPANKYMLKLAISQADKLVADGALEHVNKKIVALFNKALENAKKVDADELADQATVNEATSALLDAIQKLSFTTDTTALEALVAECDALNLDDYLNRGKDEFRDALAHAKAVLDDEDALDEVSINAAFDRLSAARNALILRSSVDLSNLEFLVAEAEAYNLDDYLDEGKEEFVNALAAAKAQLADPGDQSEINEAVARLMTAMLALRRKPVEVHQNVANMTVDAPESVEAGDDLVMTLKPNKGYALPSAIRVQVGTETLGADDYSYDSKTGTVRIDSEKLSGDVLVTAIATPAEAETVTLYRVYNPNSGEHVYTTDASEVANLVENGWNDEDEAWTTPAAGAPVFRLYNPNAGDHHYTTSAKEKDDLVEAGWIYEKVAFFSADENGEAVYRLYNPNAKAGAHHFTVDKEEAEGLVKAGWKDEEIGFYGVKK